MAPEYLFEVDDEPSRLHVFCISKKQLKTYELGFAVPYVGTRQHHVGESIYLGGGVRDDEFFSSFWKI